MDISYDSYNDHFCGDTSPGEHTSSGNTITVTFHSDYMDTAPGFSATWYIVSTASPGPESTEAVSGTKMFSSPVTLAASDTSLNSLNTYNLGSTYSSQAFVHEDTVMTGDNAITSWDIESGSSFRARTGLSLGDPLINFNNDVDLEWLYNFSVPIHSMFLQPQPVLIAGKLTFFPNVNVHTVHIEHLGNAMVEVPEDLIPLDTSSFDASPHTFAATNVNTDLKLTGAIGGHTLPEFDDILYKSIHYLSESYTFDRVTFSQPVTVTGGGDNLAGVVYLSDTTSLEGSYSFDEVGVNNVDVNGEIDGVDGDGLAVNLFLKDVPQTISDACTFHYPSSIIFESDIVGDGDYSNGAGYLNDQMVETLIEIEDVWSSLRAAKLSAQVEANVICQHVNNLNQAYSDKINVDFYQLLQQSQTINFESGNIEMTSFQLNDYTYLVALDQDSLMVMMAVTIYTDSSPTPTQDFSTVASLTLETDEGGSVTNARNIEVIPWTEEMYGGTVAVTLSVVTDEQLIFVRVLEFQTELRLEKQEHVTVEALSTAYAHELSLLFVASQDETLNGYTISISFMYPSDPESWTLLWEGEEHAESLASAQLDVVKVGEQLQLVVTTKGENSI